MGFSIRVFWSVYGKLPSNFQRKTRMRERFGFFDASVNGTSMDYGKILIFVFFVIGLGGGIFIFLAHNSYTCKISFCIYFSVTVIV